MVFEGADGKGFPHGYVNVVTPYGTRLGGLHTGANEMR
jgi:hypothetical protein